MTKSTFSRLSEKAQWDLKVALRGPDSCYGETLKWFTTSVIRGQMADVFRVGGTVNGDLKLVILPSGHPGEEIQQAYAIAGTLAWNYAHFIDHVRTAAEWLDVPVLKVDADLWHTAMRGHNVKVAGAKILAAGEKWNKEAGDVETLPQQLHDSECSPAKHAKLMTAWAKHQSHGSNFYKPDLLSELSRHLQEGRIY